MHIEKAIEEMKNLAVPGLVFLCNVWYHAKCECIYGASGEMRVAKILSAKSRKSSINKILNDLSVAPCAFLRYTQQRKKSASTWEQQ